MDEITYTVLEIAYKENVTREQLTYEAKNIITPSQHDEVDSLIVRLFNSSYLRFYTLPGFSINPLTDKVHLSDNARKLFVADKAKRDKQKEIEELNNRKLKVDFQNAETTLKSYPRTRLIAWASFIIAVILLLLKIAEALKLWPYHKLECLSC